MAHSCSGFCWALVAQHQGLSSFSLCPHSVYFGGHSVGWDRTQPGRWLSNKRVIIPWHSCSALKGKRAGFRGLDIFSLGLSGHQLPTGGTLAPLVLLFFFPSLFLYLLNNSLLVLVLFFSIWTPKSSCFYSSFPSPQSHWGRREVSDGLCGAFLPTGVSTKHRYKKCCQ